MSEAVIARVTVRHYSNPAHISKVRSRTVGATTLQRLNVRFEQQTPSGVSALSRTTSATLYHSFLTTMLSRQAFARAATPAMARAAPAGARNMATLREIEMRLKSVRNIEKITKVCHACRGWVLHNVHRHVRT